MWEITDLTTWSHMYGFGGDHWPQNLEITDLTIWRSLTSPSSSSSSSSSSVPYRQQQKGLLLPLFDVVAELALLLAHSSQLHLWRGKVEYSADAAWPWSHSRQKGAEKRDLAGWREEWLHMTSHMDEWLLTWMEINDLTIIWPSSSSSSSCLLSMYERSVISCVYM